MANPDLGTKQVCPSCQTKFYDLGRRPAVCPKCATAFDPEEAVRNRRARTRATPDYESEDEPKVAPVEKDGEEFEEPDDTPEIDEAAAVEENPVEDGEDVETPGEPGIGVDFEEEPEELEEAETEDVPFLEEEEDEGFGDEDLEHPGKDRDEP